MLPKPIKWDYNFELIRFNKNIFIYNYSMQFNNCHFVEQTQILRLLQSSKKKFKIIKGGLKQQFNRSSFWHKIPFNRTLRLQLWINLAIWMKKSYLIFWCLHRNTQKCKENICVDKKWTNALPANKNFYIFVYRIIKQANRFDD